MKKKKQVFLSGAMRGVPRNESLEWREMAEKKLSDHFIIKHAFRGREEKETMPSPACAVIRDKRDILDSDIVLVNDSFEDVAMVGTSMEVLLAHQNDKVVILFGDAHKGNYWLEHHSHARIENLDKACQTLINLFSE